MDAMGNADEVRHDEHVAPPAPPLVTSEAMAVAGLLLVALSPLMHGLFQFLSFVVADQVDSQSPAWQFALYAGPTGVLAALGAALGARAARDGHAATWARSVGGASVAVGAVVVTIVVIGIAAAFAFGDTANF